MLAGTRPENRLKQPAPRIVRERRSRRSTARRCLRLQSIAPFGLLLSLILSPILVRAQVGIDESRQQPDHDYYADAEWNDVALWLDEQGYAASDPPNVTWNVGPLADAADVDEADDNPAEIDETQYDEFDFNLDYDFDFGFNNYEYLGYRDYYEDDLEADLDDEVEDLTSDSSFGYDRRFAGDDWFYDYYDDGYLQQLTSTTQTGVSRYYDYDSDGYYDARLSRYDTDQNGEYETSDYRAFNETAVAAGRERIRADIQRSVAKQAASGTVKRTKRVSLPNAKHRVVQFESEEGKRIVADLGPTEKISHLDVQPGDAINVNGLMIDVGEKQLLIARQFTLNGETVRIRRNRRRFRGRIASAHPVTVQGRKHLLVMLVRNDKRRAADLGPLQALDAFNLAPGAMLTVWGPPVRARDRLIILAQEVVQDEIRTPIQRQSEPPDAAPNEVAQTEGPADNDDQVGRTTSIDPQESRRYEELEALEDAEAANAARTPRVGARSAPPAGENAESRSGSVFGEVVDLTAATVRGEERQIARITTDRGNTFVVDLGPVAEFDAEVQRGDHMKAHGVLVMTSRGEPVVLAQRFRIGETLYEVPDNIPGRRSRSVSGKIIRLGTATVAGQQRRMVTLVTSTGTRIHVDLGPQQELEKELDRGEKLRVTGTLVPSQDQPVLLARQFEHDGQTTTIGRRHQGSTRPQEP